MATNLDVETRLKLKRRIRCIRYLIFGGLTFVLVAGVVSLWWSEVFLVVEGGNQNADVIVVLGGGYEDRALRALELYERGDSHLILISGVGDCWLTSNRLVQAGVPTTAIVVEPESKNTRENADFSVHWLSDNGMTRAIVVTSWYHSRRALSCFQSLGGNLEFSSFPAGHPPNGTRRLKLAEIGVVVREYLAIAWYMVRYGITPRASLKPPKTADFCESTEVVNRPGRI